MKRLNKLLINSGKVLKNEELVTLRGGYGGACCKCSGGLGYMLLATEYDCNQLCSEASGGWSYGTWQCII